jgi:Skp family chaperone for outer membrane proteins
MKKIIFILIVLFSTLLGNIGYIDTAQIIQSYNKAIAAQAELVQKQVTVQDFFDKKQKEYESFVTEGTTESEMSFIMKNMEQELENKRQELLSLNEKLSVEIESDILNVANIIAQELSLNVVLDKKSILAGGIDITEVIINKLNNTL